MQGEAGDDSLSGGDGNDSLLGGGGADYLSGGEGDDSLNGGVGDDYLYGGAGSDTLEGGGGLDLLIGDSGEDIFQFSTEPDGLVTIHDFTVGQDTLSLSSLLYNPDDASLDSLLVNVTGSVTEQEGAKLIYNQSEHQLYFDADGLVNGNAEAMVVLSGVTSLTQEDVKFYV
ncbi:hypothetical protein I6L39_17820 [Aeromonas sp. FDAARGOS 1409]|nr:hypothetical protein I6L39_17820 [Aeromonas sp. FDAARGOS 1409]